MNKRIYMVVPMAMGLFIGCASMKVDQSRLVAPDTLQRPVAIYIKSFDPGTNWRGDFGGRTQSEFIAKEIESLYSRLLIQLREIAPTQLSFEPLPLDGWLVTGRLLRVDAGSGAARFWVGGFGVGAREVEAHITIYDLARSSNEPMISFPIDGGSRAEEGIMGAVDNLEADWDRIAREIRSLINSRLR